MYSTINLNRIPDMKAFMELVDRCENPVYIHLGSTEICDLKSDETARRFFSACKNPVSEEIKIKADAADSMIFLNYLINAA